VLLLSSLWLLPLAATSVTVTTAKAPTLQTSGVPVARITYGDGLIEQAGLRDSWRRVNEGVRLKTGDRLRTGPQATARVAFPWASVTVGPSSVMAVPPSAVLSTRLEEGRLEQHGEGSDIIKHQTDEALIRGRGRVVVRRQNKTTLVTAVDGSFRVEVGGRLIALAKGQGCRITGGEPPSVELVETLPPPPRRLRPGSDPLYVAKGQPLSLSWEGASPSYHVQVLPVGSDEVLLARDVKGSSLQVDIPWLGTFRWRVSAQDAQGQEGVPSAEGYVCVVEK